MTSAFLSCAKATRSAAFRRFARTSAARSTVPAKATIARVMAACLTTRACVKGGPAPRPLEWFSVTLSKDNRLLVDKGQRVGGGQISRDMNAPLPKRLWQWFTRTRVGRSIFRVGLPESNLERSQAMVSSFLLHVQPAKVHRHALTRLLLARTGADFALLVPHPHAAPACC